MLRKIIEERRASGRSNDDMLDALLINGNDTRASLTDEQLIDLIITLIYSGFETVSTTSMMAIKYLHEHPTVLKELVVRMTSVFPFISSVFRLLCCFHEEDVSPHWQLTVNCDINCLNFPHQNIFNHQN